MATMLVQHKVKNYEDWKKIYDSVAGLRTTFGEISDCVYRDASDANKLTLIFDWDSMPNAQKWAQSPELKAAMEKAGVDGAPSVSFLNEM
jgi:antibiotic biosynthesis monooxygenase (ABM) superfamily enzyme